MTVNAVASAFSSRVSLPVSHFSTAGLSPLPFVTILSLSGTVLTARTNTGVTESLPGLYTYVLVYSGVDDFVVRWDEGTPTVFVENVTSWPSGPTGPQGPPGTSGGVTRRASRPMTYYSRPGLTTVFFTALRYDGTVLVTRTQTGVTEPQAGLYLKTLNDPGIDDFLIRWDEGNATVYGEEAISWV